MLLQEKECREQLVHRLMIAKQMQQRQHMFRVILKEDALILARRRRQIVRDLCKCNLWYTIFNTHANSLSATECQALLMLTTI